MWKWYVKIFPPASTPQKSECFIMIGGSETSSSVSYITCANIKLQFDNARMRGRKILFTYNDTQLSVKFWNKWDFKRKRNLAYKKSQGNSSFYDKNLISRVKKKNAKYLSLR